MAVNDNMTQEEYLVELINCNKEVCECISSVKKEDYAVASRLCEIFINSEVDNSGEVLIPTIMHLKIALHMLRGYSNEEKSYDTNEHDTMLAYLIYLNQTEDGILYNKVLAATIKRTAKQLEFIKLIRDCIDKVISGELDSFPNYTAIKV